MPGTGGLSCCPTPPSRQNHANITITRHPKSGARKAGKPAWLETLDKEHGDTPPILHRHGRLDSSPRLWWARSFRLLPNPTFQVDEVIAAGGRVRPTSPPGCASTRRSRTALRQRVHAEPLYAGAHRDPYPRGPPPPCSGRSTSVPKSASSKPAPNRSAIPNRPQWPEALTRPPPASRAPGPPGRRNHSPCWHGRSRRCRRCPAVPGGEVGRDLLGHSFKGSDVERGRCRCHGARIQVRRNPDHTAGDSVRPAAEHGV
jgi:hypothetical protein